MSKQRLLEEFAKLNRRVLVKKKELAAKILPLVQEFTMETGLLVRSVEPGYVESTPMGGPLREFVISSAKVYTDVDIRCIGNRIME